MLYIVVFVSGVIVSSLWRILWDRGHAVFGVKDQKVQSLMKRIIKKHVGLTPLHVINSGPTHQQVYSGGTVIAWFEKAVSISGLPSNVRSFVVWGRRNRQKAARQLVAELVALGHTASIHQPLEDFPFDTFLLVKSSAFIDSGYAFRPHWIKMAFLDARAKSRKKK